MTHTLDVLHGDGKYSSPSPLTNTLSREPEVESNGENCFDITATYLALLRDDAELTAPVAAIEALVEALSATPTSTVSETLEQVSKHIATLKASQANSLGLSAGTDLFQRYLIASLQKSDRGIHHYLGNGNTLNGYDTRLQRCGLTASQSLHSSASWNLSHDIDPLESLSSTNLMNLQPDTIPFDEGIDISGLGEPSGGLSLLTRSHSPAAAAPPISLHAGGGGLGPACTSCGVKSTTNPTPSKYHHHHSQHHLTNQQEDLEALQTHLLTNGRLFVSRAKLARTQIAHFARHFIRDGITVLTHGGSRVVSAVLRNAAESVARGTLRFRVVYILDAGEKLNATNGHLKTTLETIQTLRHMNVPVATIPSSAVGHCLSRIDMVIVGAEGVVENGGVVDRLGTYQIALLAKSAGRPFYVVAESHKFVRMYPLGQQDLPVRQEVLRFWTESDESRRTAHQDDNVNPNQSTLDDHHHNSTNFSQPKPPLDSLRLDVDKSPLPEHNDGQLLPICEAVDFTPPDLISGIITERGVLTPSAVSEELIKIWY